MDRAISKKGARKLVLAAQNLSDGAWAQWASSRKINDARVARMFSAMALNVEAWVSEKMKGR